MSYYDPFTPSEKRQSFRAEDLYELESAPSRTASSNGTPGPNTPPGLQPNRRESYFSVTDSAHPDVLSPSTRTQRRRLSKPRPTSLSVGPTGSSSRTLVPPVLGRTGSSSDSLGSTPPGSAGGQVLFRAPPSATSPAAYGPYTRLSIGAFDDAHGRESKGYSIGHYDYSLPPTGDADTAFLLGKPSPDPKRQLSQIPSPSPSPYPSRLSRGSPQKGYFEKPPRRLLALHVVLCLVAWPAIYFMTPLVRASLFWTRAYVGVLCSAFGIPIGFSLLELVRRWAEAAGKSSPFFMISSADPRG